MSTSRTGTAPPPGAGHANGGAARTPPAGPSGPAGAGSEPPPAAAAGERAERLRFPDGFVWGAATASYQIEGAADADGRGPSIWDTFSATPGAVRGGHSGRVACDHYHRYADDVALMAGLGLAAYRFSMAWPRVPPDGAGPANPHGIAFYDRLADELLAQGITPYLTPYHWDLPQALEDRGGWRDRDTAHRFADYAAIAHERLGDRVEHWTTLNEPWCSAFLGHASGLHAPGRSADPGEAFAATHHLLLGHGLATRALRDAGARDVSLVLNLAPVVPHGEPGPAIDAAVRIVDGLQNRVFLDPVLRGSYPDDVVEAARRFTDWSFVQDGDLEITSTPIDLLGVNYYRPIDVRLRPGDTGDPSFPGTEGVEFVQADPARATALGWSIEPGGLTDLLVRLAHEHPGTQVMITENGAAFDDAVVDGRVHDTERIAFLDAHVRAAHAAIEHGVDLRGYLVWSLLDNFEWAEGYGSRFGIVHVDYATQRRTLKDSALWYRGVLRDGLPAAE